MRNSINLFLAASLFFLGSCAIVKTQTHDPIMAKAVAQIAVGDSAEVVTEVLGAPTEVIQLGLRSAYRYDFTETKSAGLFLLVVSFYNTDSHQDRVWVFLDEENRVSHVGSTLAAAESEYSMPWSGN